MDLTPSPSLVLHRSEGLLTTYWIGDYPVCVFKHESGEWALDAPSHPGWMEETGLDGITFPTRRAAVEAFEAAVAVEPLPLDDILPMCMLTPQKAGYELRLPDGHTYHVLRNQGSRTWSCQIEGRAITARSLWWMRVDLANHFRTLLSDAA